ncbi:hypothetical protein KPL76_05700 [Subtercola sp. PAMC28395]|uniref:hypothetical protein n=1 Tax=Subtercola sp. PAMC28395 TaxID=2846775 RepID=UPI001C0E4A64|nr:hypothetical protein [Subtercola sp. PAMC28395]QWT24853.1 hypothetical protein KPL76_05700 [Subtercola sp. PAMC28395]
MRVPSRLPRELNGRESFRVSDGLVLGVTAGRLRSSDLEAPFWGIRSSSSPSTIDALCSAYSHRMPERAFFCHQTATQLLGCPLPLRLSDLLPLHLGVIAGDAPVRAQKIITHRLNVAASDLRLVEGHRVLRPARLWCQLAGELDLKELVAAGDFFVARRARLCSVADLTRTFNGFDRLRGAETVRAALDLISERAESPQESHLRVAFARAGFPAPEVNEDVFDERGLFVARPDLRFSTFGICVEYEGDGHRVSMSQWRHDVTRTRRLEELGWRVFRVTGADSADQFSLLVTQLARVLCERGWRGPDEVQRKKYQLLLTERR